MSPGRVQGGEDRPARPDPAADDAAADPERRGEGGPDPRHLLLRLQRRQGPLRQPEGAKGLRSGDRPDGDGGEGRTASAAPCS